MNSVTIQKSKISKEGGVVILSLKEYQKLQAQAIPTYHLSGKVAERADKLVEEGLKAHKEGKTISANSLGEALKIYERRTKNRKS